MSVDGDEVVKATAWLSRTGRQSLNSVKDELKADLLAHPDEDPDQLLERTFTWCHVALYRARIRKSYQQLRIEKKRASKRS